MKNVRRGTNKGAGQIVRTAAELRTLRERNQLYQEPINSQLNNY